MLITCRGSIAVDFIGTADSASERPISIDHVEKITWFLFIRDSVVDAHLVYGQKEVP